MAAFNEIQKKMEEERLEEETKSEVQDLVASHREQNPWLMITYEENDSERHLFYSISEERYYVRSVPKLKNKYVACCYGGWLVLRDKSGDDYSILNILTMEVLQLPPLNIPLHHNYHALQLYTDCVMSSSKMDRSCRVIFFERSLRKFWSCHLGDSEFIERKLTYRDGIKRDLINFKGKLYAVTRKGSNLIAFDFSDPGLHHEQVISGESLPSTSSGSQTYLVESCEDLLLVFIYSYFYSYEVSDVKIFKADFSIGEWVELETLGDRAIFLGTCNNTFSAPATTVGTKGNVVYWFPITFGGIPYKRQLYMYDIEDKSISMALLFPIDGTYSSLSWVSIPMNYNKEKKSEQKDRSSLFEDYSPIETNLHVQRGKAIIKSTGLQIEQRKSQKREKTKIVGSTIVRKESLWADLPNHLLLEIFPHLFAGDKVAFRSVCKSWYSISPPLKTTQQFVRPLTSSDCSAPLLMCADNKIYHPIHCETYSMDFLDKPGAKIRAARDGWLLMDYNSTKLFFYNPFTKEEISLPDCDAAAYYYSAYFSAPPTSGDCLVVVAALRWDNTNGICFKKCEDEGWTCREISSFRFSHCNPVVYKGSYYFLGSIPTHSKLLIFNPKKNKFRVIEDPKLIYLLEGQCEHQYMLEIDDKLIAVFVGEDGSLVYTCEWNVSASKWEILGSLGNLMLFVSRPLSLWKRATISGTGNKIYFPRVVGDGHILFYSLATRRYHTFEMGSSYPNFSTSKYYPQYSGWFMT